MKKYLILAILLIILFFSLALLSVEGLDWKNLRYSGVAITSDELSHIPCGYYYLKTGRYFLNPEHPPLVKDIAAFPLLFVKPYFPNISDSLFLIGGYAWNYYPYASYEFSKNVELINDQWDWGRVFLFRPENNPDIIAFWSRLAVIIFNSVFLFILYYFVSRAWNRRASLIALFLLVFSQFNLAHGSLVTMDFMSSLLQMIALVCFALYIKDYAINKRSAFLFVWSVLFSSLSLLAKDTAILIIPTMFIGGMTYLVYSKKSIGELAKFLLRFSSFSLAVIAFVSGYYIFHTFNMDNGDTLIHIAYHYPNEFPRIGLDILASLVISNPVTKALAVYIEGLIMVFLRVSTSYQSTYFLGKTFIDEGASRWYFPILFVTKIQFWFLLLMIASILTKFYELIRSRGRQLGFDILNILLGIYIIIFLAISLTSNLQIGLRHIMPVIFGVTILVARFIDNHWNAVFLEKIRVKYVYVSIFVLMIFSILYSFPNYLSYYNILGGGTDKGYEIAVDSNYDWGQDVKGLVKWAEENKIPKIYGQIGTGIPIKWYLGDAYEEFNIEKEELPQTGSYVAISIGEYQKNIGKEGLEDFQRYSQLRNNLVTKIGATILIFQVP